MSFFIAPMRRFRDQQSGAVTVEYLPFIAGIMGIGLVVAVTVSSGANDVSAEVSDKLSTATVDLGTSKTLSGNGSGKKKLSDQDVGGDPLKNVGGTTPGHDGTAQDQTAEHAATGPSTSQPGGGSSGGLGNPGNDKAVGQAGENPSGKSIPGNAGNGGNSSAGGNSSGSSSSGSSAGGSGGSASLPGSDFGNPGNDKDVGKAGETPNGDPNWGGPTKGSSDAESGNDDSEQKVAGNNTGGSSSFNGNNDDDDDDDDEKEKDKKDKKDRKDRKDDD